MLSSALKTSVYFYFYSLTEQYVTHAFLLFQVGQVLTTVLFATIQLTLRLNLVILRPTRLSSTDFPNRMSHLEPAFATLAGAKVFDPAVWFALFRLAPMQKAS